MNHNTGSVRIQRTPSNALRSICCLVAAVIVSLAAIACTPLGQSDTQAIYLQRFQQVMDNGGFLRVYEPQEPVAGAASFEPLPQADTTSSTINAAALTEVARYAKSNHSDAVIVWHRGEIQLERYFNSVDAQTPLVSKSLSKPLTAIAIGRAIEQGKIQSLDQSVADYIHEWRDTPKVAITVRHLLGMRSGLLAQGYSRDPASPWNVAYLSPDHGPYIVNEYPLQAEPGSQYLYSNATAELVAVLIERATGQRYGDFISKEVLAKINAPGGSIWVNREGGLAHSGCCMYLPAESWLRLGILLLNDGVALGERLLPIGYVSEMRQATPQNPHYGLGVWIGQPYAQRRGYTGAGGPGPQVLHSEPYLDPETFLFDGNSNQVVYILPQQDMVVLRLGKTPPKPLEWDNSVLPNLLIRGTKTP